MYGRARSQQGGWIVRASRGLLLFASLAVGGGATPTVMATEPTPAPEPAATPEGGTDGDTPRIEVSSVTIRPDGPAVPGARVRLEAEQEDEPATRYHWEQIDGPPVDIADPSGPSIMVTLPSGADQVVFHLVTARGNLTRLVRVTVPIQGDAGSPRGRTSGKLKADAGDDQVGLVGYRVTLNGSRSVPGDGKGARWIQVAGPAITGVEQKGPFYTFIPSGPGLHKFLLVVAGDAESSEPDEVNVLVGYLPAGSPIAAPATAPNAAPAVATPAPAPLEKPEQILAARLPHLPDGPRVASDVADVMEAVASRATLYESFAALQNELGRRLDVVVPSVPSERGAWSQGVFQPLAAYTAAELLPANIDIRAPQGLQQSLTPAQQERVREYLQSLARAFRAASKAR